VMDTCHNCGKSVAGQRFCTACGTPIVGPEPSDPQAESTSTAQWGMDLAHSGEPPPRGSRAIVLAVTVVTAVVLMAAVGGYLALRPGGLLTATTAGTGSAAPTASVSTTVQPSTAPSTGSTASVSDSVTNSESVARSRSTASAEASVMTSPGSLFAGSDAALISLNDEIVSSLLGFTPASWSTDQTGGIDFGGPLDPPQCLSIANIDATAGIGYHSYGFSYLENQGDGPVGRSAEIAAKVLPDVATTKQAYDNIHSSFSQCLHFTTPFSDYTLQPLDVPGLSGVESFSLRQTIYFHNDGTSRMTAVTLMHDRNAVVGVFSFADDGEQPTEGDIDAIAALTASNLRATR